MPKAPHRPCRKAGCNQLVQGGGYCPKHKDDATGWNRTNAGKNRHQRGYGYQWDKKRKAALKRDRGLCQPCLKQGLFVVAKHVDHIKPKAQGGSDDMKNLQSICVPCHRDKTARERKG